MPAPALPDLSLVPTDDLIEKLANRSDGLVIAFECTLSNRETEIHTKHAGSMSLAIGLTERLRARLTRLASD
jgi:hypothetical protein